MSLSIMVEHMYEPLLKAQLFTKHEVDKLFINIPTLLKFNKAFLSEL